MSVKTELAALIANPSGYVGTVNDLLGDAYLMVTELSEPRADVKQWEAAAMISVLTAVLDEVAGIVKESPMIRVLLFTTGTILCAIPAVSGVFNGASILGLTLIATTVATHIAIERHQP